MEFVAYPLAVELMEMATRTSKHEVAQLIRSFLDGSVGIRDWDDFTSVRRVDPEIETVRQRLVDIYDKFPADKPGYYGNAEGAAELLRIADSLDNSVIPQGKI